MEERDQRGECSSCGEPIYEDDFTDGCKGCGELAHEGHMDPCEECGEPVCDFCAAEDDKRLCLECAESHES